MKKIPQEVEWLVAYYETFNYSVKQKHLVYKRKVGSNVPIFLLYTRSSL